MAGWPFGTRDYPDRVLITINPYFDDVQKMPAAFTFLPKLLAAAGEKMDGAGLA